MITFIIYYVIDYRYEYSKIDKNDKLISHLQDTKQMPIMEI